MLIKAERKMGTVYVVKFFVCVMYELQIAVVIGYISYLVIT